MKVRVELTEKQALAVILALETKGLEYSEVHMFRESNHTHDTMVKVEAALAKAYNGRRKK